MSYVIINGDTVRYREDIMPFTTQHGVKAVRFTGDSIPTTDKGFKMYDDNDNLLSDLSEYTYEYRPNEYSIEEDVIENPGPNNQPLSPSSYDVLSSRINKVSAQVSAITPFEETKKAYYAESEKVFYNVPEGNTSVFFSNYDGEYTVERVENRLTVKFAERLKDMTNVTVMVNK